MAVWRNEKGQAVAGRTEHIERAAFGPLEHTEIRWLGGSGAMINSRGTCVFVDPVLSGFDMPLLIEVPLTEEEVPHLDGVLLTHCDNDHYSRSTCRGLRDVTEGYHGPSMWRGF